MSRYQDHPDYDGELARRIDDHPPRPGKGFAPAPPVTISLVDAYEFEGRWNGRHSASKEEDIRDAFGCSAARYYQILNRHLDSPEGLRYEPQLTRRLRDQREERAARRADRTTFTIRKART